MFQLTVAAMDFLFFLLRELHCMVSFPLLFCIPLIAARNCPGLSGLVVQPTRQVPVLRALSSDKLSLILSEQHFSDFLVIRELPSAVAFSLRSISLPPSIFDF